MHLHQTSVHNSSGFDKGLVTSTETSTSAGSGWQCRTRSTSARALPGRAQRPSDFGAWPRTATFRLKLSPESTRKLYTRGISRARSFDLEVAPWAPTRLTSCISHHRGGAVNAGHTLVRPRKSV